jgi:hypothetical protein
MSLESWLDGHIANLPGSNLEHVAKRQTGKVPGGKGDARRMILDWIDEEPLGSMTREDRKNKIRSQLHAEYMKYEASLQRKLVSVQEHLRTLKLEIRL